MSYLIYKTDNHHSYHSRELIGVAYDRPPIEMVREKAQSEAQHLTPDDELNLANLNQTQQYNGDGQFTIEPFHVDELF